MKIYLISNRKVVGNTFQNRGKERAQSTFRIAKCELDEANKTAIPTILPDKFDPDYEDVVRAISRKNTANLRGTAQVFYDLYTDMVNDTSDKGDVLFFVHGFANKFEDNMGHIYDLHRLYIKPDNSPIKHLIYVSWPTIGSLAGTYKNDQRDAERTGQILGRMYRDLHSFFLQIFERLELDRCKHKIHFAAHSMGNQVLREMLEMLPDHRLIPIFGEVLLLHADVEDDVFEPGMPFNKLEHLADRTHIYIHRSDDALRISRFTKNFNKRLGFKGPKNRKNLNEETFIVDTTNVKGAPSILERFVDHWGYMHKQEVIDDIIEVLRGSELDAFSKRKKKEEKYYSL